MYKEIADCQRAWETDNLSNDTEISEHIFAPNGGYSDYYPSNIFSQFSQFYSYIMMVKAIKLMSCKF